MAANARKTQPKSERHRSRTVEHSLRGPVRPPCVQLWKGHGGWNGKRAMGDPVGWRWPTHQPTAIRKAVVTKPVALRSWNKLIDLARKSIASLDICATRTSQTSGGVT